MELEQSIEWQKAQRGELYYAFTMPELIPFRDQCSAACRAFNANVDPTRRKQIELWRRVTRDKRPLPPRAATQEEDDKLFVDEPWIQGPGLQADYGFNIRIGAGAFLNFNATFIDTCPINIGARTLIGPGCSFYSGTHPLDPAIRNGLAGPESGKPINIGEDCWLGGNVIVLPGVTIGRGSTIGAGSVVTKDVPAFHLAAGNPARILRRIATDMDSDDNSTAEARSRSKHEGAEILMAEAARP